MRPGPLGRLLGVRPPRGAATLVASLLIGFAIGAAILSFNQARTAARVTDAEYVLMVSNLFEHERSAFNARERLQVLGRDPIDVTEAAAESIARERPEARQAAESVRQMAAALRQADAEAAARPGVGVGTIAVLIVVLVSLLVSAGAAWIWKSAELRGHRFPIRARSTGSPREGGTGRGPFGGRRLLDLLVSPTIANTASRAERVAREQSPVPPAAPATFDSSSRGQVVSRPAATGGVFRAQYALGEDPFDDVFTICDDRGEEVGACGLSATEASDRPGRYYGFTLWVQQYRPSKDLAAIGLVNRAGQAARSAATAEWRRRGTIDDLIPVEPGTDGWLVTGDLSVRFVVDDVEYTPPTHGSPGYFGRLAVTLTVD